MNRTKKKKSFGGKLLKGTPLNSRLITGAMHLIPKLFVSTALAVLLLACGREEERPSLPPALEEEAFETDPALPLPEEVWVRPGFEGGAEILWSFPRGTEDLSCQAQIGRDPAFEDAFVCDAGEGPSFQIKGLKEGENYYFRLRSVREDTCSEWGQALSQTAVGGKEDPGLEAPYDGSYVMDQEDGICIVWKKFKSGRTFEVYRSETGKDAWTLADGNAVSDGKRRVYWTDPAEAGEGSCYYLVRTIEEEGKERTCSAFGNLIEASFLPLSLKFYTAAIPAGDTRTFEAYYGWGGGKGLVWTSSDPETASVDDRGNVTGIRRGTAYISVSLPDGSQTAVMAVYVDRQAPPVGELPEPAFVYDGKERIFRQREKDRDGRASVLIAGDLMSLQGMMFAVKKETGYDFAPCFSLIRDTLEEADIAAGNLETLTAHSYSYSNEEYSGGGKPLCNTSPSYLQALRLGGFDLLTMSNNHNADWGQGAARETVDSAEKYGFLHTGLFRDGSEDRTIVIETAGIRIGFLAYDGGGVFFNGKDEGWPQEDKDTILNAYSGERAEKDIKALRDKGADYIIVCMHWGIVNEKEVTKAQKKTARELADLGADYIAGSHAHLVQPFKVLTARDGRQVPCLYSLGNFTSDLSSIPGQRDSVLLRLVLERDREGKAVLSENAYIPCHTYDKVSGIPYATVPLTEEKADLLPKGWEESRDYIRECIGDQILPYEETTK